MKILRYTEDLEPVIAWAKFPRKTLYASDPPPKQFSSWVKEQLPSENSDIRFWVTEMIPNDMSSVGMAGGRVAIKEWERGFPHAHKNTMGWDSSTVAMMVYLKQPLQGGEIGIGGKNENDPYMFYKPEPGLAVMVNADEWHGVRPVLAGERLAVVIAGFPEGFKGYIPIDK